jgi:hypothetical protein
MACLLKKHDRNWGKSQRVQGIYWSDREWNTLSRDIVDKTWESTLCLWNLIVIQIRTYVAWDDTIDSGEVRSSWTYAQDEHRITQVVERSENTIIESDDIQRGKWQGKREKTRNLFPVRVENRFGRDWKPSDDNLMSGLWTLSNNLRFNWCVFSFKSSSSCMFVAHSFFKCFRQLRHCQKPWELRENSRICIIEDELWKYEHWRKWCTLYQYRDHWRRSGDRNSRNEWRMSRIACISYRFYFQKSVNDGLIQRHPLLSPLMS